MKGIYECVTDAFSLRLSQEDWIFTVFVRFSLVKYSVIGCAQISSVCKAGLTVMGVLWLGTLENITMSVVFINHVSS